MEQIKKIKSGRVSKAQKMLLIQYMRSNRSVGCGQFKGPDSAKAQKEFWKTIAVELNSGIGATKTGEQWKKCWIDWKSGVKKLYSAHKKFNSRTGNLPSSSGPKPLDGLDEEVVEFFATDTFEGDGGTSERGLSPTPEDIPYESSVDSTPERSLSPVAGSSRTNLSDTPVPQKRTRFFNTAELQCASQDEESTRVLERLSSYLDSDPKTPNQNNCTAFGNLVSSELELLDPEDAKRLKAEIYGVICTFKPTPKD